MLTCTRTIVSPVASLSEKGEADKARARRLKKTMSDFASREKSYVQSQYRWMARQHARAQSSFKKAIDQFKADWQEDPGNADDSDVWKSYHDHISDDFLDDEVNNEAEKKAK